VPSGKARGGQESDAACLLCAAAQCAGMSVAFEVLKSMEMLGGTLSGAFGQAHTQLWP